MQKHYELTYIVSIKYLEDELKQVMEQVSGLVQEQGGSITAEQILGKQRLAYPIKFIHQGTYVIVEFDIDGANLKKLDDLLKLKKELLRHIIVAKKVRTEEELKKEKEIQERLRKEKEDELKEMEKTGNERFKKENTKKPVRKTVKVEGPAVKSDKEDDSVKVKKEDKKVSFEDIDKKIDEILTEEIL